MFCVRALTLSQSKFGVQSSGIKTHATREVTVRPRFNWIILTAPGAPCGCYDIHSEAVVVLFDVMFRNRFGHFLPLHCYFSIYRL